MQYKHLLFGLPLFHVEHSEFELENNSTSAGGDGRGRKLGVLGNLGESLFRGFSLRVFHLALYPKPKTRSFIQSTLIKLRGFPTPSFPVLQYTQNEKLGVENLGVFSQAL